MNENKNFKMGMFSISLAFLCMGFGDAVGPFVSLAKVEFQLSDFVAGFVAFAGFIMFGILSIPMGIYQDRRSKKHVLILGLIIAFIGLIIPVFGSLTTFGIFLITIVLLGAGAAILQVAGNPLMRDVSPEGKYSRNLSFGQFVKAIGSLTGPVVPPIAVKYFNLDWKILFPLYSSIILLTIVILSLIKIKEERAENNSPASFTSCFQLLVTKRYVWLMVLGIFLYVGAEVSISQGAPLYLNKQFGVDIQKMGLLGTGVFFTALTIGRFSGSVILNWLKPRHFLIITSVLSVIGILFLFVGDQAISTVGFFVIGLGFANIFPLIFSITIDAMPDRSNELSGLMITSIAGGAIIPLIMNAVSDITNSAVLGFLVPIACIIYIIFIAIVNLQK